ncbi:uncharacterized protein BO72DRAFT_450824 [Aspergillus fijiensis CBS 313.89]|uniref:Uncharacterized protein n=1 Tax=Aspergillus fijiensis CBS 313.89 TaxID=1448319 RepID=A0A8G1VWH9_9EURO|nr:uncharacterized protein BO72DRAFT_450824 [Aspergillus fijiensis CBS 313.89]RAK74283.1 hypothetical protein BO72DRAFT_450824 [Aspergillus fijiensis CBS 313.89]
MRETKREREKSVDGGKAKAGKWKKGKKRGGERKEKKKEKGSLVDVPETVETSTLVRRFGPRSRL